MKKYAEPMIDLFEIKSEIITTSGTETTVIESDDGVWDLDLDF